MLKKIAGNVLVFIQPLNKFIINILGLPKVLYHYSIFNFLDRNKRFSNSILNLFPCVGDNSKSTEYEPHYLYHPAWAARIISQTHPVKHIDISSTLRFSTIVSAFTNVEFYDYRPAKINLSNLKVGKADLTKLPFKDDSIKSLSCMHTIEHIGLGRYGDKIDPNGDLIASRELERVLSKGGNLLIVVPIGKPMIAFNAHRIYVVSQIRKMFRNLKLVEFSLVPDDYRLGLIKNPKDDYCDKQNWGCGCFWFRKD